MQSGAQGIAGLSKPWGRGSPPAARSKRRLFALPATPPPSGGAWTIGYKAWGAALARRLVEGGALVACLDYRNFPQASAVEVPGVCGFAF